jgi:hypothetical protein
MSSLIPASLIRLSLFVAPACASFLLLALSPMPVSAQTADPLDFTADFVVNAEGDVFIQWHSAPGFQDVVESSSDKITWSAATTPVYGLGQVFSVAVPDARVVPGTGSGGDMIPIYTFTLMRYASGEMSVRWSVDGVPYVKQLGSEWESMEFPGALTSGLVPFDETK